MLLPFNLKRNWWCIIFSSFRGWYAFNLSRRYEMYLVICTTTHVPSNMYVFINKHRRHQSSVKISEWLELLTSPNVRYHRERTVLNLRYIMWTAQLLRTVGSCKSASFLLLFSSAVHVNSYDDKTIHHF